MPDSGNIASLLGLVFSWALEKYPLPTFCQMIKAPHCTINLVLISTCEFNCHSSVKKHLFTAHEDHPQKWDIKQRSTGSREPSFRRQIYVRHLWLREYHIGRKSGKILRGRMRKPAKKVSPRNGCIRESRKVVASVDMSVWTGLNMWLPQLNKESQGTTDCWEENQPLPRMHLLIYCPVQSLNKIYT